MKTRYAFIIAAGILTAFPSFAQGIEYDSEPCRTYCRAPGARAPEEEVEVRREVTVSGYGQLAEALGDEKYDITTLAVTGPINSVDLATLWDASFNGTLRYLDLSRTEIENDIVPAEAFWHGDVQVDPYAGVTYILALREITLPDNVTEIGDEAFSYVVNLQEINIPKSLRRIGKHAFSECVNLRTDPLVFPEGFEELGDYTFLNCRKLKGAIIFPSTLRIIGKGAFFSAKITSIELKEGLETIGEYAFHGCRLKDVVIPSTCLNLVGDGHFDNNLELESIVLPEGLETIPKSFASCCIELKKVTVPESVRSIGTGAFSYCHAIEELKLPENLRHISVTAFEGLNSIHELVLPPGLETLGERSIVMTRLQRLYVPATEPPTYAHLASANPNATPFGIMNSDGDRDGTPWFIPVYIPKGTIEKYRASEGWRYFTNFIETDEFPGLSVDVVRAEADEADVYNLQGVLLIENATPEQVKALPAGLYIVGGEKVVIR